jgi:hypothetical protein
MNMPALMTPKSAATASNMADVLKLSGRTLADGDFSGRSVTRLKRTSLR